MHIPAELYIAPSVSAAGLDAEHQHPSADVRHFVGDRCGIATVHEIVAAASRRGFGTSYTFVLAFQSLTNEAQNALLKLTEEPPAHTRIILIVPSEHLILSTLRSRLLRRTAGSAEEPTRDVPPALGAQLERIRELHKAEDGQGLRAFLRALIEAARPHAHASAVRAAIRLASQHTHAHNGLLKRMLEHLAYALASTRER